MLHTVSLPLLLALPASSASQDPPTIDARALFLEHCASCHGERGDGEGATELPRPARSFLDGGFSYGNTRASILRSVTHGIPGTPMPAFALAVDQQEREALVDYVLSLGPELEEVSPADTVLTVEKTPLVVRGYLPALIEDGTDFPRGLLLGAITGATFQYSVDDVRLVCVRQGEFVERRDWSGRGGQPLQPLGTMTYLVDRGDAGPTFHRYGENGTEPLTAELTGTWTVGREAGLSYRLKDANGRFVARVRETPTTAHSSIGAGFQRKFEVSCGSEHTALEVHLLPRGYQASRPLSENPVPQNGQAPVAINRRTIWLYSLPEGDYIMAHCSGTRATTAYREFVRLDLMANTTVEFKVSLVTTANPSREAIETLDRELR